MRKHIIFVLMVVCSMSILPFSVNAEEEIETYTFNDTAYYGNYWEVGDDDTILIAPAIASINDYIFATYQGNDIVISNIQLIGLQGTEYQQLWILGGNCTAIIGDDPSAECNIMFKRQYNQLDTILVLSDGTQISLDYNFLDLQLSVPVSANSSNTVFLQFIADNLTKVNGNDFYISNTVGFYNDMCSTILDNIKSIYTLETGFNPISAMLILITAFPVCGLIFKFIVQMIMKGR